MIVTTAAQLAAVVEQYLQFDEFVLDIETVYDPVDEEERARADRISAIPEKKRTVDDHKWYEVFKFKATDPRVNRIIWIGLAGPGGSSVAIPVGHPKGRLLSHEVVVGKPAHQVYPEGDPRRLTKQGKLSGRTIKVKVPATFAPPPPQLWIGDVMAALKRLFFNPAKLCIGWNVKFDIKTMAKYWGTVEDPMWPTCQVIDALCGYHVLDEKRRSYKLEQIVQLRYGQSYEKLGSKGVENFSFGKAARYAAQDCRYTWLIWRWIKKKMGNREKLWRFYREYERLFYDAIMEMEYEGIMVDRSAVAKLRVQKEEEIRGIMAKLIVDYGAPDDFNPNANAQVAELIYKRYRAPVKYLTKEKKEPQTTVEALTEIAESTRLREGVPVPTRAAPVARLLLDYSEQNKILSTYLIGTIPRLDDRDRLHADYTLHGTETSRLSCREPNIQNIPRESVMRSMYMAPPGYLLVVGDYDQIELRWIAWLAKDPAMMALFVSGEDIHRATAAAVLGIPFDQVTPEQRQTHGKMPNFLLGYGGSAFNLAQKTGTTEEAAQKVLDAYFRRFSRINPWKYQVIRQAKARARFESGQMKSLPYVETMLGRRRRLPDLFSPNGKHRAGAERQAVNTLTQGGASETALLAMVGVTEYRRKTNFPMKLVINVHDELVCLVPEREADEAKEVLAELMSSVVVPHTGESPIGDVPLAVKVGISDRWEK